MLGSLILYLKGMRISMFQLSGFYCTFIPAFEPLRDLGSPRESLVQAVSALGQKVKSYDLIKREVYANRGV